MLQGSTEYWWNSISGIEDVNVKIWDRFKYLFRNKCFIAPVQAMKNNEFIQLREESMNVREYSGKYEK